MAQSRRDMKLLQVQMQSSRDYVFFRETSENTLPAGSLPITAQSGVRRRATTGLHSRFPPGGPMKANSILDTIGNTPHIRVNRLFGSNHRVWIKSERANPGGSIKDR